MTTSRYGISTHLYHRETLRRDHLLEIAANGFEAVEVFATRGHFDYHDPAAVDALATWLEDAGLALHSIHSPIVQGPVRGDDWGPSLSTAARDERARTLAVAEAAAALGIARRIPAGFLVVHLGTPSGPDQRADDNSRDAAVRSVEEIRGLAAPLGVRVALEVIANELSTATALAGLIEDELELGADVGICLDLGHGGLSGGDPVDAIEIASGHVTTTHIHDNFGAIDDHLVPFEGAIDWPSVLMAMQKIGYEGAFMLELRNTGTAAAVLEKARGARRRFERLLRADG